MRYLIQLAYLGTAYHGWQRQDNAHTVQAELEEKLSLLTGMNLEIIGCGRTDTGVHAKEYFAHVDLPAIENPEKTIYKLNQMLPTDIVVNQIKWVHDGFHARFDATYREYEYHITLKKDPFAIQTAWYRFGIPDIDAMNDAALLLLTHTDFECFSKVHTQVNHFDCDIMLAHWEKIDDRLVFTIRANRFLRNMVRAIVGTLLEVGHGRMSQDEFRMVLESKSRSMAGQSVPAHGLFLTRIQYAVMHGSTATEETKS